jgi:transcriptional regulator with XRE-family HTH domain
MLATEHSDLPPSLNVAIATARYVQKLTASELGRRVGTSAAAIIRLESGRGTLATFCDVVRELGYVLDVRTWEYKRLLRLAESRNAKQLCEAVKAYSQRVIRSQNSPRLPRPTDNQRIAVNLAESTCPLAAFEGYMRHVGLRCVLVKPPSNGEG